MVPGRCGRSPCNDFGMWMRHLSAGIPQVAHGLWPGMKKGATGTPWKEKASPAWGPPTVHLKMFFTRSVQLLEFGECFSPPFLKDSSSSLSSLRWCSVSLTGVSTTMWQYRSPG